MSENIPKRRRASLRLLVGGAALLFIVIFLAWTESKRVNPVRTSAIQEPSPTLVREASSLRKGNEYSTNGGSGSGSMTGRVGARRILRYGRGEGEVGMIRESGQTPIGPESFAVGNDGSILVVDVVNERLVIYASDGTYDRSISLPGIAIGDVAVDRQGRVYVYDQARRALHQYGGDGTPRSRLDLNPKDIDTRGYFHVVGDSVYFADAAVRDVLVATLQDGLLTPPDKATERMADGIHGESGRVYSLSLDRGKALRVELRDTAAQSSVRALQAPMPGIVSARYAGEDDGLRFYVQTERLAGTNIVLEVLTFSPTGEQLATTRMPENDYAIWTTKLVDVRADGTIVQFLPQRDQATLSLFTN